MGHGDIRQMAPSARLCLHCSHCSSKKKKKKQPGDKVEASAWCVFAGVSMSVVHVCVRVISPYAKSYYKYLSDEIHTAGLSHSTCRSSQAPTNCLLFSRGQGPVGLQSTQWGPCVCATALHPFRGSSAFTRYLYTLSATLPARGPCTCSRPLCSTTHSRLKRITYCLIPPPAPSLHHYNQTMTHMIFMYWETNVIMVLLSDLFSLQRLNESNIASHSSSAVKAAVIISSKVTWWRRPASPPVRGEDLIPGYQNGIM